MDVHMQGRSDSQKDGSGREWSHPLRSQFRRSSPQNSAPLHNLRRLLPGLQHPRGQRVWPGHLCLKVRVTVVLLLSFFTDSHHLGVMGHCLTLLINLNVVIINVFILYNTCVCHVYTCVQYSKYLQYVSNNI